MNKFSFFCLLLMCFIQNAYGKSSFSWLAFGSLMGHMESCGCDPNTDLGGLKRIAAFIDVEKASYPESLVFDLGNNLLELKSTKSKYLAVGLSFLPVDAALFNFYEFKILNSNINRPYVLGNIKKHSKYNKVLKSFIIKKNVIITGFLWNEEFKSDLYPWQPQIIQKLSALKKEYKHKEFVLLFSGLDQQLDEIIKSQLFDLIISDNKFVNKENAFNRFQETELLIRKEKPLVKMVPLHGMGVLRGGDLLIKQTQTIHEVLEDPKELPSLKTMSTLHQESNLDQFVNRIKNNDVTWLDRKYQIKSSIDDYMNRYESAVRQEFLEKTKLKKTTLKDTPYSGSETCKYCHTKEYRIWKKSKHAKAYATLEHKNKHEDSECVSCHVVGFDNGGFISKTETQHFSNVQCENCHGPRKEHAKNPKNQLKHQNPKETCKNCHHAPHSPNFHYQTYWENIRH